MCERIPENIRDFVLGNPENKHIEFLSFNDWLNKKDNLSQDWIVVAQRGKLTKYSDLFTISCLVEANQEKIKKAWNCGQWEIGQSFGVSQKYQTPWEGEEFCDRTIRMIENIKYTPFTFLRQFDCNIPDKFDIIQHFILYFNAFWVEDKLEYQATDEEGNNFTLIKCSKDFDNDKELIKVDAHFLKDYLAVKKSALVRFHDHRRQSVEDISVFLEQNTETYFRLDDEMSFFQLDFKEGDYYKSMSSLMGKDLVLPYEEPISHEFSIEKLKYVDFIISRDKNGKETKLTCNPRELRKEKNLLFYSPIYFKKQVLQKYYAEPNKYEICESNIFLPDYWRLNMI